MLIIRAIRQQIYQSECLSMNRTRPYLNRFVKKKQQEIEDSYHSSNLREIKPITSKLQQHSETIIINNSKREMIKQVREIEIERENKLLLQKISSVMSKKGTYSVNKNKNIRTKINKSLNEIYRKKQLENIQLQNKRFLQRLQEKRPTVNNQKLNRDWVDNKSTIRRMANFQFNLTNIKSSSRVRAITTEKFYKSKYDKIKITKFKVIDGQKMLIKVQFTDEVLKIIGDAQDKKDIKIIEIPKEEAILFIEKDCNGKIELLLQKLKYDVPSETLYLVSDHLEEGDIDFADFNPQIQKFENKNGNTMPMRVDDGRKNKSSVEGSNKVIKQISKESIEPQFEKSKTIHVVQDHKRSPSKPSQKKIQIESPNTHKQTINQSNNKTSQKALAANQAHMHVNMQQQEQILPQQQQYEQQKFEQSHQPVQYPVSAPVSAPQKKKTQPQQVEKQIIVQPQEQEDYNQEFEASGSIKKSPEQQQPPIQQP